MHFPRMQFMTGAALCSLLAIAAGCDKSKPDTTSFKTAINNYYSAHPRCVWSSPVKLPAQADASNDEQTKGFDALTDAGLLTRTPQEKKRFLIGSKQVNDYDVSDKGRTRRFCGLLGRLRRPIRLSRLSHRYAGLWGLGGRTAARPSTVY